MVGFCAGVGWAMTEGEGLSVRGSPQQLFASQVSELRGPPEGGGTVAPSQGRPPHGSERQNSHHHSVRT